MLNYLRNKPLAPVFFVMFMDNFSFAMIYSIFGPLFLDPVINFVDPESSIMKRNIMLGFALGLFPLGQLFGSPFIGDLSDKYGRKKTFYISILAVAAGIFLTGFAIFLKSFSTLIILRFITGFFSGNLSICFACIADLSKDDRSKTRNFAMVVVITGLSWMLSILIGEVLSDNSVSQHFNPSIPFFVAALMLLLSWFGIYLFFKESHIAKNKVHFDLAKGLKDILAAVKIKSLRTLNISYMFFILGWGLVFSWMSPYAMQKFQVTKISANIILFSLGVPWIFGGYFLNKRLAKSMSPIKIAITGSALLSLFIFVILFSKNYATLAFGFLAGSIPAAFLWPNLLNAISGAASEEIQGKVFGITQSFQSVGFIVSTALAGFLAGFNITSLLVAAAVFQACCFACLLVFRYINSDEL